MSYEDMMKELGVDYLTAEPDRTGSGRVLFDIPALFELELREYLGAFDLTLPEGMNDREKVGIMMHPAAMREFVIWLARRRGWYVVRQQGEPRGEILHFVDKEYADDWRKHFPMVWIMPPFEGPTRNQHMMSGRFI